MPRIHEDLIKNSVDQSSVEYALLDVVYVNKLFIVGLLPDF
jgi:hypothetical protein